MVCSLYNINLFEVENLNELILYFNKLVLNSIKIKETKLWNNAKDHWKKLYLISSYIRNNNIIEIADIEFVLD